MACAGGRGFFPPREVLLLRLPCKVMSVRVVLQPVGGLDMEPPQRLGKRLAQRLAWHSIIARLAAVA